MEQYGTSTNSNIDIKEFKNKHDQTYPSAKGMVISWTVRSILQELKEQGVTVSYGVVLSLRPIFITFATEKEIALCLYKLCLNMRMFFEPLMTQVKRANYDVQDSITEFYMYDCECPKFSNGYYH